MDCIILLYSTKSKSSSSRWHNEKFITQNMRKSYTDLVLDFHFSKMLIQFRSLCLHHPHKPTDRERERKERVCVSTISTDERIDSASDQMLLQVNYLTLTLSQQARTSEKRRKNPELDGAKNGEWTRSRSAKQIFELRMLLWMANCARN